MALAALAALVGEAPESDLYAELEGEQARLSEVDLGGWCQVIDLESGTPFGPQF